MAVAQIETRITAKRQQIDRGIDIAWTYRNRDLRPVVTGANCARHSRNCDRTIEMVALNPILKFAGTIARVCTNFKGSNDDNLGSKRSRLRCRRGWRSHVVKT